MAAKLDVRHHTFLQAVLKRGPLSEKSALTMFKSLVKSNSGDGFVSFLGQLNKELEFVQMEVKKVMNQYDGQGFYGIINTLGSKEAKLGTTYSQAQIVFFTAVMESIVRDPSASGAISSTGALNLKLEVQGEANSQSTALIKMTMQAKQEALSLLVDDQLLCRTADGRVALGVKAFLELRTAFRNLEVPFCEVCNEAAIKAELCSNEDCSVRMHSYCFSRKFQACNKKLKCSGCQMEWKPPVEEEGDEASAQEENVVPVATPEPNQVPVGQRKRGRNISRLVKEEIVDDENENSTSFVGPVSRRARSRRHKADEGSAASEDENPKMRRARRW